MKLRFIFAPLLIAVVLLTSCNKKDYTASIPDGFKEYCQKAFEEWKIPGMSVVVVKDGEVVFLEGFGKMSLAEDAPDVDPVNTQFVIASTSKAFTGALLATVIDKYDVSWDDPVCKILPDFKLWDPWASQNIMVKEVMTHKTGFKTYALDDLPFFGYDRDDLYHLFSVLQPTYSFRSKYAYNNEMYTVAAKIIEKYTGESWDDAIVHNIYEPLEMTHSTTGAKGFFSSKDLALGCRVAFDAEKDSLVVTARDDREDAFTWLSAVAPAAFVMTTAQDMGNWIKMHLNHGTFNGKEVISRKNHNMLFYPQTITSCDSVSFNGYAQGWTVEQSSKCRYIRHTGLAYGYTSLVGLVPELNLGFAFLTNNGKTSDAQAAIARQLIDMYLGIEGSDYSKKYLDDFIAEAKEAAEKEKEPKKEAEVIAPLRNKAYIGRYHKDVFGTATVYEKEGSLYFKLNKVDSPLTHISGDKFSFRVPGAGRFTLTFTQTNGNVKSLTFDIGDPIGDFKKL